MKRLFRPLLVLSLVGAAAAPSSKTRPSTTVSPGVQAAQTLSEVTGIAISPLLGTDGGAPGLLNFPPRYQGHETALASACGVREVHDVGLPAAWTWIKQALGFGAATT